jgi:hypothetical protein
MTASSYGLRVITNWCAYNLTSTRLRHSAVQEGKNDESTNTNRNKETVSSVLRHGAYTTDQSSVEEQWRLIYARDGGPLLSMKGHL